jgi:SH3-like domain-containing protein
MMLRSILVGVALAFGLAAGASAAPGVAKGSVNLRAGPGTNHARIATIPAGAPVNVLRCGRWCEVIYSGRKGWASAAYISRGGAVRGGYVVLPDKSLCHGPGVWSNPYCEWPIERSAREFGQSTRDFNNRQDHGGGGSKRR